MENFTSAVEIKLLENITDVEIENEDEFKKNIPGIENMLDFSEEVCPELSHPNRGPGRSKIVRSRSREGRSRKEYQQLSPTTINIEETEEAFVVEVRMNQATSGFEADQWYNAMREKNRVYSEKYHMDSCRSS